MVGNDFQEATVQAAAKTLRLVTEPTGELETLFQAHHDRVFRTAHRITGSPADAEDVLQTVFLRLVKSGETYDLSQNPEAYLSRAAINASLDLMRSRGRTNRSDSAMWMPTRSRASFKTRKRNMPTGSCKN